MGVPTPPATGGVAVAPSVRREGAWRRRRMAAAVPRAGDRTVALPALALVEMGREGGEE